MVSLRERNILWSVAKVKVGPMKFETFGGYNVLHSCSWTGKPPSGSPIGGSLRSLRVEEHEDVLSGHLRQQPGLKWEMGAALSQP